MVEGTLNRRLACCERKMPFGFPVVLFNALMIWVRPSMLNFCITYSYQTQRNALLKSMKLRYEVPLVLEMFILMRQLKIWSTVLLPALKPACSSVNSSSAVVQRQVRFTFSIICLGPPLVKERSRKSFVSQVVSSSVLTLNMVACWQSHLFHVCRKVAYIKILHFLPNIVFRTNARALFKSKVSPVLSRT